MFTDKPLPLDEPPLPERIQPNDLSKGIVEAKLAEAEPDIVPSSATFIVNTVSSMDISFLYIYMLTVPPIGEGVHDQDQVFAVSSSPPSAILSAPSSSATWSSPTFMENLVPVIDIWLYAMYMFPM